MLFSEFQEGTGCRDNEHNHQVYKDLEVLYTNSNKTKAEIYEYGKKLVDNSDTEEEKQLKAQIKADIKEHLETIKALKEQAKPYIAAYQEASNKEDKKYWKDYVKLYTDHIRQEKQTIQALRWVLA